jgi:hypothetical protein
LRCGCRRRGGPVELDSPVHEALMVLLGAQARREVVCARHRVLAAMRVQARVQGGFLGGRPSYGYRLVDSGPHPRCRDAVRYGRDRDHLGGAGGRPSGAGTLFGVEPRPDAVR